MFISLFLSISIFLSISFFLSSILLSSILLSKKKELNIGNNKDEIFDKIKPKLIPKNNVEGKQTKIISFKEFLEKEEENKWIETSKL